MGEHIDFFPNAHGSSRKPHAPQSIRLERYIGDVDITESPVLSLSLDRLVICDEPVVLDMTGVHFLGTSALSLLTEFAQARLGMNRGVAVAASRSIRRPLEVCGVHCWFTVTDTVDEAVHAACATDSDGHLAR